MFSIILFLLERGGGDLDKDYYCIADEALEKNYWEFTIEFGCVFAEYTFCYK